MLRFLFLNIIFFLTLGFNTGAQFPHCPVFKPNDWKGEAAFANAQDTVKNLVRWLNDTPIAWEYEQRTKANLYVLNWMTAHPTKKWSWSTKCFGPLDDNVELMYAFIHASLYYCLTHERPSESKREIFVLQSLSKKIEQSKTYDEKEEWKELVKAVRKHREEEYFNKCKGQ